MPLFAESEPQCAPFGEVSASYEILLRAEAAVESRSFGEFALRIPEAALREHSGVVFDLACSPPTSGSESAYVIPEIVTGLPPLGGTLPATAPFTARCGLAIHAGEPTRLGDCVPWDVFAIVEAKSLEELSIEIVALHDDETSGR